MVCNRGSQGLGLILVKKLLAYGYRVAAASRYANKLKEKGGEFRSEQFLPISVDLNTLDSIEESIQQTLLAFGTIDVVVNNAEYLMIAVEETPESEINKIFEV